MQKKKVIILGAGISGLSLAWYLQQSGAPVDLVVLEKTERAGGWLRTENSTGFVFEKGPRAFKAGKSLSTLQLLSEIGLQEHMICADKQAHARYLWVNRQLHRLPQGPVSLLTSSLTKGILPALFTEWKKAAYTGDETVWDFISRRFSPDVARLFFDPLVVGIFGGDSRYISIRACFPTLKQWEEEYGSVTKGFWAAIRGRKGRSKYAEAMPDLPLSAMYSLSQGMEQLVHQLLDRIEAPIHYHTEVTDIDRTPTGVRVTGGGQVFEGDALFCALPVAQAGFLLRPLAPDIAAELAEIQSRSFTTVNVGYAVPVLPVKGFGYLTALQEQEDLLGVVFDSVVFPQHNEHPKETRLTIKLADRGLSKEGVIEVALQEIKKHLKIYRRPDAISYQLAVNAIPQYGVDHLNKMENMDKLLAERLPSFYWLGNYFSGVSVDQCIARSKQIAERFLSSIEDRVS